jgi:ribonuclease HI
MLSTEIGRAIIPVALNNGKSPLQHHLRALTTAHSIPAQGIEQRRGLTVPPWSGTLDVVTTIHNSPEEATASHDKLIREHPSAIHVYTDGSGINDKVGSSAVWLAANTTRKAYMGTLQESTVYAGEVYGFIMALEMIRDSDRICPAYIFSDNQAGIRALNDPIAKAAQSIHRLLHETIATVICPITVHWIPAHTGIPGNEAADLAAKEATGWRPHGPDGEKAPPPPEELQMALLAPLITRLDRNTLTKWKERWLESGHGHALRRLTQEPRKSNLALYRGLSIPKGALIIQMKTGKISLRKYLHSRNVPGFDDPYCDQCSMQAHQTAAHILLVCPAFAELRRVFRDEIGDSTTDMRRILSERRLAVPAARFLARTTLIQQFRAIPMEAVEGMADGQP